MYMDINPRNRPHDYFFRRTFDSAEHARDLLRTFVPAELLEGLQLDKLRREKESFVSPAEAESVLDLLYSAEYDDGTRVAVYILMEHKSWVDREIAVKLLLYVLRVQEWLARNGHPPQLVIPILVYQGEAVWDEPLSLREKVRAKPQHKQFIPDMNAIFIDLLQFSVDQQQGSDDFFARMWMMQWIRRRERDVEVLRQIFRLVRGIEEIASQVALIDDILTYMYSTTDAAEFEELQAVIAAGIQTERTNPMPTILDMLVEQRAEQISAVASQKAHDQGFEQGIEKGRTAGMLIGQIRTLEQVFQLPVTPETELNTLSVEALRLRLEQVQAAIGRAGNG